MISNHLEKVLYKNCKTLWFRSLNCDRAFKILGFIFEQSYPHGNYDCNTKVFKRVDIIDEYPENARMVGMEVKDFNREGELRFISNIYKQLDLDGEIIEDVGFLQELSEKEDQAITYITTDLDRLWEQLLPLTDSHVNKILSDSLLYNSTPPYCSSSEIYVGDCENKARLTLGFMVEHWLKNKDNCKCRTCGADIFPITYWRSFFGSAHISGLCFNCKKTVSCGSSLPWNYAQAIGRYDNFKGTKPAYRFDVAIKILKGE